MATIAVLLLGELLRVNESTNLHRPVTYSTCNAAFIVGWYVQM